MVKKEKEGEDEGEYDDEEQGGGREDQEENHGEKREDERAAGKYDEETCDLLKAVTVGVVHFIDQVTVVTSCCYTGRYRCHRFLISHFPSVINFTIADMYSRQYKFIPKAK